MEKRVLILCTGNSCRSIIAEALINSELEGVIAQSSGVQASGCVNPNAKKLLEQEGIWRESYHSKSIDTVLQTSYDLIVTVCDHAHESCPTFPHATRTIHVGFEDPDGKAYEAFEATLHAIRASLLPRIQKELMTMNKNVDKTSTGVKISFTGVVAKQNIVKMVENCATGACACMSDETKAKITNMEVSGEDGAVALELSGDIAIEEIESALANSTVLNN